VDADQAVYFANFGPLDAPLRDADCPSAIGVVAGPGSAWPIGIAFGVGNVPHWRFGPIAVFRLEVRKEAIPGRWVCVGRRFVPAEEWEEREAIREEG
jgi:hypothetical protein